MPVTKTASRKPVRRISNPPSKRRALKTHKCRCKDHKPIPGRYYFQGNLNKVQMEMMCDMVKEGINVYHQQLIKGRAYYFQGDTDDKQKKFEESLLRKGYKVFRQYGKPSGCGSPGRPPC